MDKYEQKNKVNNQQSAQVCAKISIPKASFFKGCRQQLIRSGYDLLFASLLHHTQFFLYHLRGGEHLGMMRVERQS